MKMVIDIILYNSLESHSLSERQLKIHYIKKEYEIIQQLIKIDQYSLLSDRELFFVADSEFSVLILLFYLYRFGKIHVFIQIVKQWTLHQLRMNYLEDMKTNN